MGVAGPQRIHLGRVKHRRQRSWGLGAERRRDGKRGKGEPIIKPVCLEIRKGEQEEAAEAVGFGERPARAHVLPDRPGHLPQQRRLVPVLEVLKRVGIHQCARDDAQRWRDAGGARGEGVGANTQRRGHLHRRGGRAVSSRHWPAHRVELLAPRRGLRGCTSREYQQAHPTSEIRAACAGPARSES
eukprot:scaffold14774_cov90-Isochrysis_galbana.AAC.2